MTHEGEWIEVKPRTPKPQVQFENVSGHMSPRSPKSRASSFGDLGDVSSKRRIGKHTRRERKLEWSATKRRERDIRVEKREYQRETEKRRAEQQKESKP